MNTILILLFVAAWVLFAVQLMIGAPVHNMLISGAAAGVTTIAVVVGLSP